jgi:hypothetical protein
MGVPPIRIAGETISYLEMPEVAILAAYRYQEAICVSIVNPMGCKEDRKVEPRQDPKSYICHAYM